MLHLLDWNVSVETPLNFIRFMCTFGIIFTDDRYKEKKISRDYATQVAKYVAVFVDLSSYYPELCLKYDDLEIALACVICSRK